MANIARLGVVMGLDTAEFTTGLQAVDKKLEEFKSRLLELGSIAAFAEMTLKAMEYADTIVKTAKANDVTTASILEMSRALEENGGEAEGTSRVYSGFTQKLETAAIGSAKAQESFARLGISLKDIGTLSSQELFEKTITGLAKIENAAARNGLAFQVLGKSFRGIDIVGFAKTLDETKGTMDQYAASVEQAHKLHLEMEASGRNILLMFTDAFIPTLKIVYDDLTKTNGALKDAFMLLERFAQGLGVIFETIVTAVRYAWDTIKLIKDIVYEITPLIGDVSKIPNHFANFWNEAKLDALNYRNVVANIAHPDKTPLKPDNIGGQDVIAANAKKLDAAKGLTKEYQRQADLQYETIEAQRKLLDLTKDQAIVQSAVNKVIQENQKFVDAIDKQIAGAGQGSAAEALKRTLEQQKTAILALRDAEVDRTKKGIQDTIDYQRTFTFGWTKAWNQYKEDANDNAKITGDIFNSVMGSMNSALDTFVTTGKMNFSSFAQSVIQDIEKIILKAMVAKAMTAAFGGTAFGSLLGFADGGSPPVGVPSIVGENGPELFVPSRSGTIIPNNQLTSALSANSGGGITYNGPYIGQMSAIDTQSAVQFLARNKTAVWSANQSAQRGLPTSR